MAWALALFLAGLAVIGFVSFKRRPSEKDLISFTILVLMVFGVLSLGLTGSWLERLLRPLMLLLGLAPDSRESYWRMAMFLSLVLPLGLGLAYRFSRKAPRFKWLLFIGVFLIYGLFCNVLTHLLIRAL